MVSRTSRILVLIIIFLFAFTACSMPRASDETPEPPGEEVEGVDDVEPTEEQSLPTDDGTVKSLQDVKGAVIQIEAQGTFMDPDIGLQANTAGFGTGFIIDPSGLAVTNNHVVTGAALLKVWVGGDTSKTYNAKIIAASECSDLALIDIEGDGYPYLTWHEGDITVGLEVYASGFPLGDPEYTLTRGIISKEEAGGESNWSSLNSVLEHDATINPGNSGGPLVDEEGKVVGVNYAAYKAADQYFAIDRDTALNVIQELESGNDFESVGINSVAVASDDGEFTGIWVSSVKSGSPADKADLEPGDIIYTMEGLSLGDDGTMSDYCDILRTHDADDTLSIEVFRWTTEEYMEGQLNGEPLTVAFSFANTFDEEVVTEGDDSIIYEDYYTVYDDTEAIGMEIPSSWGDVDGRIWEGDWGDIHFVAADIIAAPDIEAFNSSYNVSGVDFAASRDWGQIGGYVQLLDGTRNWFEDYCTIEGRYDYEDEVYEGKYDLWDCGGDSLVIILSARPIANPTAFLTLVQVQIITDADLDALDRILSSFDVVGDLP